jgi:uncharacterized protein with FMN-binding domain
VRRAITVVLGTATLALPGVNAWGAATAQKAATAKAKPKVKVVTAKKSFTGTPGMAGRWGDVQVTIVVKKTTTTNLKTKKKTVKRRIVSVRVPVYPDHTDRSIFISERALPTLVAETIQKQSAAIDLVSGATDTSEGYVQSLQAAILEARAW